MKVIDLLNKIANGEQPSHIRIYNRDWYWNNFDGYVTEGSLSTTPDAQIYLFSSYRLDFALDKEVEIIEEEKEDTFTGYKWFARGKEIMSMEYPDEEEKDIEELDIKREKNIKNNWKWKIKDTEHDYNISTPQKIMCDKINELVKAVNKSIRAVNELKKDQN